MPAEIVGTAYVRIRALTKGLGKEIQDGVEKGTKDAKLDKAGESAGADFVDGFDSSVGEEIPKKLEDALDGGDHHKKAKDDGKDTGDIWADGFGDSLREAVSQRIVNAFKVSRDKSHRQADIEGSGSGDKFGEGFFNRLRRRFAEGDDNVLKRFTGRFRSSFDSVTERISESFTRVFRGGGGEDKDGAARGRRFGEGFVRSLTSSFQNVDNRITGVLRGLQARFQSAGDRLSTTFRRVFGGRKEGEDVGRSFGESIVSGIAHSFEDLNRRAVSAFSRLKPNLRFVRSDLSSIFESVFGEDLVRNVAVAGTMLRSHFTRAFTSIERTADRFRTRVSRMFRNIVDSRMFRTVSAPIIRSFDTIQGHVSRMANSVRNTLTTIGTNISTFLSTTIAGRLNTTVNNAVNGMRTRLGVFSVFVRNTFGSIQTMLGRVFEPVFGNRFVKGALAGITRFRGQFATAFRTLPILVATAERRILNSFARISTRVENVFGPGFVRRASSGISNFVAQFRTLFNTLPILVTTFQTRVVNAFQSIGSGRGLFGGITSSASTVFRSVERRIASFASRTGRVFSGVGRTFNRVVDTSFGRGFTRTIQTTFRTAERGLAGFARSIASVFSSIGRRFSGFLTNVIGGRRGGARAGEQFGTGLMGSLRNVFSRVGGSVSRFAGGLISGFSAVGQKFAGIFSKIAGFGGDDGAKMGSIFGGGFFKGFVKAVGPLGAILSKLVLNPITLIVGAVIAAGPAIVQSLVGLTGMIGGILDGLLGGVLALVSGASAGLLALGPIVAAFLVDTPLLQLFKDELSEIVKEFDAVAEVVQAEVFPGILLIVRTIADKLIPTLKIFGSAVGKTFGEFSEWLADWIQTESFIKRLNTLLGRSSDGFKKFTNALKPVFDLTLSFFTATSSLAPILADDLEKFFTNLNERVNTKGLDSLSDRFEQLYDDFKLIWGALGDLTVALYNILTVGNDETRSIWETFRKWTADFREWTKSTEGVERLQEMFARAKPVMSEFFGLLKDIIELLFSGATGEDGANATVSFIQWLRNDALPWLSGVAFPAVKTAVIALWRAIETLGKGLKPVFDLLKEVLKPVVDAFKDFGKERADGVFDSIREAVEKLGPPLERIGTAMGKSLGSFFDVLLAFSESGVIEALIGALAAFLNVIAAILEIPGFAEFLGTILGVVAVFGMLIGIGAKVAGAIGAIGKAFGGIVTILEVVGGAIIAIAGAFGVAITAPAWLVGAIAAAVVAIGVLIWKNWDKVKTFFTDTLPNAFRNLASWITDTGIPAITGAFGALWDFIQSIPGRIVDIASKVAGFVKEIPGKVGSAIKTYGPKIGRILLEGMLKAIVFLAKIHITIYTYVAKAFWNLIKKIPGILAGLGKAILGAFKRAIEFLVRDLPILLIKIVTFFVKLPIQILGTLADLGVQLLATFVGIFIGVTLWLATTGIPSVVDFFKELPGKIWDAIKDIGSKIYNPIKDAVASAIDWVKEHGPEILTFFIELPGKIWEAIKSMPGKIKDAFVAAKDAVWNSLKDMGSALDDFIKSIPGKAKDAFNAMKDFGKNLIDGIKSAIGAASDWAKGIIKDIKDAVKGGIKSILNTFLDKMEDILSFKIPVINKEVKIKLPRFARGGIFDKETIGIMGEAGREVLLPLTDPIRTYQLAVESGLLDVLARVANQRTTPIAITTPTVQTPRQGTAPGKTTNVVFQPGSIVAQGASAAEVAAEVERRFNWALTTRGDR